MDYLSAEQILFIHARLIEETGGSHGVRDLSMLLSAVGRPQASYDNQDLYRDLFSQAAALMESLVRNHHCFQPGHPGRWLILPPQRTVKSVQSGSLHISSNRHTLT